MKDFISIIKNYSTRDFIYLLSRISINMFKKQVKDNSEDLNCSLDFPLHIKEFGFMDKQVFVTLSAWDIQDMAYLSIIHSNDYRSGKIVNDGIGNIVNSYRGYENEHSSSEVIRDAELKDIFKFFVGMTYEQFKYQSISWLIQNFNRNYHILVASEKINREKIIRLENIINKLFDFKLDELLAVEIMILWLCSQNPDPLSAPEHLYHRNNDSIITKQALKKVIAYYSVNYDEIRESSLKKQLFYSKPFVTTVKTHESIMVSFYLLLMAFADGLYWIVKDYYHNNQSDAFVNEFGNIFEDYFEELAGFYLEQEQWFKISVGKEKSADYYMEFEDAIFLFELKAGLLGIGAKQQTPNTKQIDSFYKQNIFKAYKQLQNSEVVYKGTKPIIKTFLWYETVMNTQIIMASLPEIFVKEDNYYIMAIDDLERLLATYVSDKEKFIKIIQSLIENKNSEYGCKSIREILDEHDAVSNLFYTDERDYFDKILKNYEVDFS